MLTAAKLAGFLAAHAVWCVSDGETLIPMLGYITADDQRRMDRIIVGNDLQESVNYGKQKLLTNEMHANDAALLFDGRITLPQGKVDAIIVEMRTYFSPSSEATIAVPYTPKASGAFRVHKPKLLAWKNCEDFDVNTSVQNFFNGVDEHEKGAKVWADCIDQSK